MPGTPVVKSDLADSVTLVSNNGYCLLQLGSNTTWDHPTFTQPRAGPEIWFGGHLGAEDTKP